MGELRALGPNGDGRPWEVLLREAVMRISLTDTALATSAGEAAKFGENSQISHLFDPRNGSSPELYKSITAGHRSATVADALSTGLYAAPIELIEQVVARTPGLRVWATTPTGKARTFGA